jgi:hypothetical protein
VRVWAAADHKFAFTITRERNIDVSPGPFFVARASCLDGSDPTSYSRREQC